MSSLVNVSNGSSLKDIEVFIDSEEQNWFKRTHVGNFFFLPIKTTHFIVYFSKAYYIVFNRLFMNDLSCLLVVRKKYANTYGKDSKYTNAIDISII